MNFKDPEEKMICPYDEAHLIRRKRMDGHLVKCRKIYEEKGNMLIVECDFNNGHRIYEPELAYHHEKCPDRKTIETAIYQEESQNLGDPFKIVNMPVPVEDWDDEPVAAYDPEEAVIHKNILRHMDVASAAKRRNFRIEERKRHSEIQRNPPPAVEPKGVKPKVKAALPEVRMPEKKEVPEAMPSKIADLMRRVKIGEEVVFFPKTTKKEK